MPEKPFATQKKPKRIGPKTQEEDGKNSANELSQLVNKLIKNLEGGGRKLKKESLETMGSRELRK